MAVSFSCGRLRSKFTKKIKVTTNDPEHPSVDLTCVGQIRDAAKIEPKSINFGSVSRKSPPQHKKVIITRGDAGPLKLQLKPFSVSGFDVQLREIEPGERYELDVTMTLPLGTNRTRAEVELDTGVAEAPTISVPVFARMIARVTAQPARVVVPPERTSEWIKIIKLVWDDDAPHKIVDVNVDDPKLNVKVEEADGRQHVVLRVPQDYAMSGRMANIFIKTDDAKVPSVKVPVTVRRLGRASHAKGTNAGDKRGAKTVIAKQGPAKKGKRKPSDKAKNKAPDKSDKSGTTESPDSDKK